MLPVSLLTELLRFRGEKKVVTSVVDIYGKKESLRLFKRVKNNNSKEAFLNLFSFFMLRKLIMVLSGRLYLFGGGHNMVENLENMVRPSVFELSEFVMDKDFRVGSEVFDTYYLFRRNLIYDIIILLRFYISNLMQVVR
jgi:hypothetical protein